MKEFFQDLFQITVTKVVIAFLSGAVLMTGTYLVSENKSSDEIEDIDEKYISTNPSKQVKRDKNFKRIPASKSASQNSKSVLVSEPPVISNKNESNYNSIDNQTDYFSSTKSETSQSFFFPSFTPIQSNNNVSEIIENTLPKKAENESKSNSDVFLGAPIKNNTADSSAKNSETASSENNSNTGSGGGSSSPAQNSCSTDILAGTFGNPIGVTITCNYLSEIKYCLSKDSCCDPQTSGTVFSGAISIGAENGNFCLSFYGDSETGGTSEVVQNNYTINNTYPNLLAGSPKTFFQTTELSGETFITSTDFGKASYYAGQINFRSTDPTAAGLNYSCTEIAENDHLSLSPIPITTLSLLDISGLLPTNEIIIPFREDKFDYGVNFLSSYIKNNSYVVPLYSCSTTQIVLEDFNYFESTMAQASAGDNNVREFEGQFSSFGFFEEDAQVFRGPAGESTNEKSGTYLESGLFSVFY